MHKAVTGAAFLWAAWAGLASAQEVPDHGADPGVAEPNEGQVEPATAPADTTDENFGPLVEIERIQIEGDNATSDHIIRDALGIKEGERLHAGDPRLGAAKYRLLGLGYFAAVKLRLDKGSRRGAVVLVVSVVERGSFTLNRIYLGSSDETQLWAGIDIGDSNLLGTGVGLSGGFVVARTPEIADGQAQVGARVRVNIPNLDGGPLGVHGIGLYDNASDPLRETGAIDDGNPADFRALRYRRAGAVGGVSYDIGRLSSVTLDGRFEAIDALTTPPDDAHIAPGESHVTTLSLGFERDTRPDPVLPYIGDRLACALEVGAGDYSYFKAQARYDVWLPIAGKHHVLAFHVGGGVIAGDAPRFDEFYVGDLNPLLPPRALDLVVSTRPAPDVFGSGAGGIGYGQVYGGVAVEYIYRLFRRSEVIYGGDLFAQVGVYDLSHALDHATTDVPIALTVDLGLRLDTEVGVFELSLGNLLGRIPY